MIVRKRTRWLVDGEWRTAIELADYWGMSDNGARNRAWRARYQVKRA